MYFVELALWRMQNGIDTSQRVRRPVETVEHRLGSRCFAQGLKGDVDGNMAVATGANAKRRTAALFFIFVMMRGTIILGAVCSGVGLSAIAKGISTRHQREREAKQTQYDGRHFQDTKGRSFKRSFP